MALHCKMGGGPCTGCGACMERWYDRDEEYDEDEEGDSE